MVDEPLNQIEPYTPPNDADVMTAADFKIRSLGRKIEEEAETIRDLEQRLLATKYEVDMVFQALRLEDAGGDLDRCVKLRMWRDRIDAALAGELRMPRLWVDHGKV